MIKKILAPIGALMFYANNAYAQGAAFFDNPQAGAPPAATAQGTLGQNITNIINFFLGLLGLIAVAMLIYAGIMMVTAGGDEQAPAAHRDGKNASRYLNRSCRARTTLSGSRTAGRHPRHSTRRIICSSGKGWRRNR